MTWNESATQAFWRCKESLATATLLTHPHPTKELAIVTDASDTEMGGLVQQEMEKCWKLLAFFSEKFSRPKANTQLTGSFLQFTSQSNASVIYSRADGS